jgi:hypothetical protein
VHADFAKLTALLLTVQTPVTDGGLMWRVGLGGLIAAWLIRECSAFVQKVLEWAGKKKNGAGSNDHDEVTRLRVKVEALERRVGDLAKR